MYGKKIIEGGFHIIFAISYLHLNTYSEDQIR